MTGIIPNNIPVPLGPISYDRFMIMGISDSNKYYTYCYVSSSNGTTDGFMVSTGFTPAVISNDAAKTIFSANVNPIAFTLSTAEDSSDSGYHGIALKISGEDIKEVDIGTKKLIIDSSGIVRLAESGNNIVLTPKAETFKKNSTFSGIYYDIYNSAGTRVSVPSAKIFDNFSFLGGINSDPTTDPINLQFSYFLVPYSTDISTYNYGNCKSVTEKYTVFKTLTLFLENKGDPAINCSSLNAVSKNCFFEGIGCSKYEIPSGISTNSTEEVKVEIFIVAGGLILILIVIMIIMLRKK